MKEEYRYKYYCAVLSYMIAFAHGDLFEKHMLAFETTLFSKAEHVKHAISKAP